jgi:four helix bundle protein
MSVYRFEDLRVWQAAKEQCDRVGMLVKRPEFVADDGISGQMNRASLSVLFNISEGFLRRRDKETLQFLRYAFSSNGEVKAGYYASQGRHYISRAELGDLIRLNESIAKMLRRWQSTLDIEEKDQAPRTDQGLKDPGRARRPRPNQGPRTKDGLRTQDQGRTEDPGRTKNQEPGTKD